VYEVQVEGKGGRIRRLYRNLLLQCNELPMEPVPTKRKRKYSRKTRAVLSSPSWRQDPSTSDSDVDLVPFVPAAVGDNQSSLNPNAPAFVPNSDRQPSSEVKDSSISEYTSLSDHDEPPTVGRPTRNIHPPRTLTNDTLGQPTVRAVQNVKASCFGPVFV
jgi:hypothetical protein